MSLLPALLLALPMLLTQVPVQAEPLTLAVSRGPVSLPVYVAQAKGLFADEKLELVLRDCSSGRACFQLMADGAADVATAAELLMALASYQRSDLAIIATLSASSQQIKLVARRSAGVQQAEQLRGKRIATVGGTSAQYFLDSWLVFSGIDPAGVTTVPLLPEQLLGAMQARQVDAMAIWEPLASAAVAALGADALALPSPRVYTQHFVLAAQRRTIGQREPELLKLLRALVRAQQAIARDPAAAKALLQARLGMSAEAADTALLEHDFRIRLDQSLVSTMDGQSRWAASQGMVGAASRPANLLHSIEPALLRTVAPGAVGLVR
jgi:NitT/TauT family transport system substrate-binding protein